MKKIIYLSFLLGFTTMFSQNLDYQGNGVRKMYVEESSKIKGDDFIYDEWNRGMIVLNDSVFSKQDYLKYDVYKDRVLIKNMKNLEDIIEITDRSFTSFSIIEKTNNLKHDFVKLRNKNFLSEEKDGFYEIVFNIPNTNYFIKKNTKIVLDPNRSEGSQTMNNLPSIFKDRVKYFIKNSEGLYVGVNLKKKDVKSVLNKNSKAVDNYIKANKIKFNNENDVMKLVNYYYSL